MADDLRKALDGLFNKEVVAKPPSMFIVNRFMAWEKAFAPVAAAVSRLKDGSMAWEVWRTALPRRSASPRLGYPAPKRPKAAEGLVEALMHRTVLSRVRAEEAVDLITAAGKLEEMTQAYGVELDA